MSFSHLEFVDDSGPSSLPIFLVNGIPHTILKTPARRSRQADCSIARHVPPNLGDHGAGGVHYIVGGARVFGACVLEDWPRLLVPSGDPTWNVELGCSGESGPSCHNRSFFSPYLWDMRRSS